MIGIAPATAGHAAPPRLDRRALLAGGVAVAGAAAAGGWYVFGRDEHASDSIAVLPFANLSGDPAQAYFSDGMAEELRSALSRIARLKVVARTSSEMLRDADVKSVARQLGVANVLTGSVRRSPSTIRVSTQLIDGSNGLERWSETFDRPAGDVLRIQSDIARAVAQTLQIQLGGADRAALNAGTTSAAAQDLVFQANAGRDQSEIGTRRAIQRLDAAIAMDPNYAEAHAGKALVSALHVSFYAHNAAELRDGLKDAAATAHKALTLNPNLALGHAALSTIRRNQLDLKASLAEARAAYAAPGRQANFGLRYAGMLSELLRPEDALRIVAETEAQDPLNPQVADTKARVLFDARRYVEGAAVALPLLAEDPQRTQLRSALAVALLSQGKTAEARRQFGLLPPTDIHRLLGEGVLAARARDAEGFGRAYAAIRRRYGDAAFYQYAMLEAQRGDFDQAFADLDSAWRERDPGLPSIQVDPYIDPLRNDPRYAAFVARLNFPRS